MRAVYYRHDQFGYCPVKKYFEQYAENEKDSKKQANRKLKLLVDIDAKIKVVVQNDGRPIPPISAPLKEYGCIEIKHRKNQDILIRIIYFRHDDKIVLLHAFEKPDHYETNREKKIILKEFEVAKNYKNIFIINPKSYEEYN